MRKIALPIFPFNVIIKAQNVYIEVVFKLGLLYIKCLKFQHWYLVWWNLYSKSKQSLRSFDIFKVGGHKVYFCLITFIETNITIHYYSISIFTNNNKFPVTQQMKFTTSLQNILNADHTNYNSHHDEYYSLSSQIFH